MFELWQLVQMFLAIIVFALAMLAVLDLIAGAARFFVERNDRREK